VVKALVPLVLASGCFWHTYPRLLATHVDLLVAMARKGTDLVAAGRFAPESMPELAYPLERAEAFARTARAKAGTAPPPSLAAFEGLLERYRSFLETLDRVRRVERGAAARAALAPALADVEAAADRVRAALGAERQGHARGKSTTRLSSFSVASSVETDCPSCGWITWGASSASGISTKRRLCSSGCGTLSERRSMIS